VQGSREAICTHRQSNVMLFALCLLCIMYLFHRPAGTSRIGLKGSGEFCTQALLVWRATSILYAGGRSVGCAAYINHLH
jgi:hypothetical protein